MEFNYLCIFAAVMCIITFRSFRKKKNIIHCMMWLSYSVSAVACVLCSAFQETLVGRGIMHDMWYDLSDTTWWSYILMIVCFAIAFRPLAFIGKYSTFENFGKGINYKKFFILFSYLYIICVVIFVALSLNNIIRILSVQDLGNLRAELYGNSDNEASYSIANNIISKIAYKACLQLKYLAVFIAAAMFKESVKTRLATTLLVSSFFVYYITANAVAGRGGLLIYFFCIFLISSSFIKYMGKWTKRKIRFFGLILLGIILLFAAKVTIQRFSSGSGNSDDIIKNVFFYLGHGPIEFSKITGSLGRLGMGKAIGGRLLNHYFGTYYNWKEVQMIIGYPPIGPVFTTFLGYLYTDFGFIGCLIFVTLWSSFMKHILLRKHNRISTLFMLGYYLQYYITGIFGVGRMEYAALITSFIIYFGLIAVEQIFCLNRYDIGIDDDLKNESSMRDHCNLNILKKSIRY